MLHKKHTYEAFGVREYWLINLEKETVTQYLLRDEEFESQRFSFNDEIVSEALPGYKFRLSSMVPKGI